MKCPKCQTENPDDSKYCKECASSLTGAEEARLSFTKTLETPLGSLTRGTLFADRYEIIEELGTGGMGSIYRVEDKKIHEDIAIKLIKPEIAADKRTIERFSNELKIARKIRHKNVCQMFDLGEEKGTRFITMEYVPGEDLKNMIRMTKRLSIATAINIGTQLCEGLTEAHRLSVVHRDLKPSNIMIDKEGNARIMDFGIARSLESKGITDAGVMIGTPEYMSPEQVEGKDVDQRSDIYSLGVILYEMVTGRVPFEGDSPFTIGLKHKSEVPKNPQGLNAQVTDDFSHTILRCLEKAKENRYQTSGELRSDLANIAKGLPTTKRVHPDIRPEAGAISKTKWENSIAVLPFSDLSPQRDQEYFCDGMTEDIITKLSRMAELKVISRTSAMRYKRTDKDIKEIGEELGVATILEGSIRKEGDNIRVTAQLINVEDGFHLWADTYNRKLESVFEVQDEVSKVIAEVLEIKLTPGKIEALKATRPKSVEAYEYVKKGLYITNSKFVISHREKDFNSAVKMFNKAVEIDPDYPMAYTGLNWAYQHHNQITGSKKYLPLVIKNCEKAYELDQNNVDSNAGKAWMHYLARDFAQSYFYYKRGLEIDPNRGILNHVVGVFYQSIGLIHQAIDYLSRAVELDPFYLLAHSYRSKLLIYLKEFKRAEHSIEKAMEVEPDNFWSLVDKCLLYIMKEKISEAEKLLGRAARINPGYSAIPFYKSIIFAVKGDKNSALALNKNGLIYSLLGMKDKAIKYIEDQAKNEYEHYQYSYLLLINSPFYDNLRDDARFEEIIRKQKQKYEDRLKRFGYM
jgi:serine/threonine protein kinase/tetratricopeptide (TPR) repeat protein